MADIDASPTVPTPPPPGWSCFTPTAFADQIVMITGATGGMGSEMVRAFLACGARVVAADLAAHGSVPADDRVLALDMDVSDERSVLDGFAAVDAQWGVVDHVVHAAAVIASTRFLDTDAAHWRRLLDVNLIGSFLVAQQAIRRMVERSRVTLVW